MLRDLVRDDFKALDKRDALGSVYGWLKDGEGPVPIVCDEGRPFGVLNTRALLRTRLDLEKKVGTDVIGTRTVDPRDPVDRALGVAAASRIPYVPVAEDGRLVGYVRVADCLRGSGLRASAGELAEDAAVVSPTTGSGDAMRLLRSTPGGLLPVVDAERRLLGIVGVGDLLQLSVDVKSYGRKAAGVDLDPRSAPVEGHMRHDVAVLPPEATFDEVVDALGDHGYVVVATPDRRVLGLITPESVAARVPTRLP